MVSLVFSPEAFEIVSIAGSLEAPIKRANNNRAVPITAYGIFTEAASCTR
jgi:hypothetical protein